MDALLMCGGVGSRLAVDVEKPLLRVGGRPMVERVRDALRASRVDTVHAVGSPATPETLARVAVPTVEAPGEGYVSDLAYALERTGTPALTAAADLPLLEADLVDAVLAPHEGGSLSVCVPTALKRSLGVSVAAATETGGVRELSPTGLNVVGDGTDSVRVLTDERLAVNVNRLRDAAVAEALL